MSARWWARETGGAPAWLVILGVLIAGMMGGGALAFAEERRYTPPDSGEVVISLGDSYTAGTGASDSGRSWVRLAAAEKGWRLENLARGGTGFATAVTGATAPAACGQEKCPSFAEMAVEGAPLVPDIVLISGGRNDARLSAGQAARAIRAFLHSVASDYPHARIVVTNVLWDDDTRPDSLAAMSALLQSETERIGGEFIDIGQPLRGDAALVAADGVHPSDAGHRAIADAFLAELE